MYLHIIIFTEKCIINKFVIFSILRCPLYFDHFGAHENSVDTASKEVIDELKIKKPKWLDLINFDMLVSEIKYGKKNKPNRTNDPFNEPAFTPNELIGILTGDINIFQ